MKIYKVLPKYAFLFENSKKYNIIYEFGTQKEYEEALKNRVINERTSYYIGYPGSITTYLQRLMYLSNDKIPVITVYDPNNIKSNIVRTLDERTKSLEKKDGIKVSYLLGSAISDAIWRYMKTHRKSVQSVAALEFSKFYIGNGSNQYFYISKDLAHFKKVTSGTLCVCGSHTWETLPLRKLPGRQLAVLTSRASGFSEIYKDDSDKLKFFSDIHDLLIYFIKHPDYNILSVIGGTCVYEDLDPFVTTYHITEICYKGSEVPWKEGDKRYPFSYDPHSSHETEELVEISRSAEIEISEYLKFGEVCTDPLSIIFHEYKWKALRISSKII